MLKVSKMQVYNWEGSLRGMRNPMNSWHLSDTDCNMKRCNDAGVYYPTIGPNDYSLCKRLVMAGPDHRKFLRQLFITIDIDAPFYWWKEFDTYKVGTVANSCSTMHKIQAKEFTRDDFSCDRMGEEGLAVLDSVIEFMEKERLAFIETKDKAHWHNMIQMLPTSYNQLRTVTLNYEVAANIWRARRHHKLSEWHTLCDALEQLPYSEFITHKFEDGPDV